MFDYILSRQFQSLENLRFIQIGANDGSLEDPLVSYIEDFGWAGVMYEPLPQFCDSLRRKYAGNAAVRVVNAAVCEQSGNREIYFISSDVNGMPQYATGLGTFDYERIGSAARKLGIAEQDIARRQVTTVNWSAVLTEYGYPECDVLAIDAEGYDYEILKMIDFDRFRPKVIHFEHSHLTLDDRATCYKMLLRASYDVATWYSDTTAWRLG
jgi:FkbM family methyltransferase